MGPRTFSQKIVLLPEYKPTVRPPPQVEDELTSRGFGLKLVEFVETDDVPTVKAKIYGAFSSVLLGIRGIQMYTPLSGWNMNLNETLEPLLPAKEMERKGKVYIARLFEDDDFPNVVRLSRVMIKCPICKQQMDQNLLKLHNEVCRTEDSSSDDDITIVNEENPSDSNTIVNEENPSDSNATDGKPVFK